MVRKWECRKQTFQSLFGGCDRCPLSMNTVNSGLEAEGMLIGVVVGEETASSLLARGDALPHGQIIIFNSANIDQMLYLYHVFCWFGMS